MLFSPRSALLIFTALSASSVAPAQVGPASEPMVLATTNVPPQVVTPQPITIDPVPATENPIVDELAPLPETAAKPARPTGDLATLVAQLRSSDPGSRELECLAVGIYFES